MHVKTVNVNTQGRTVSSININQYDTLEELVAAETPEKIVSSFNTLKVENERNLERAKFQPTKASSQKKMELGYSVAFSMFRDELEAAIAKGPTAMTDFVKSDKVQAEVEKMLGAPLAQ